VGNADRTVDGDGGRRPTPDRSSSAEDPATTHDAEADAATTIEDGAADLAPIGDEPAELGAEPAEIGDEAAEFGNEPQEIGDEPADGVPSRPHGSGSGPRSGSVVRVLLVDDHEVILDGLRAMLHSQRWRVRIVARARDADQALAAVADYLPDVVLLDVRLGRASGLDVARVVLERHPQVKVVFFTVYDDEQYLFQALRIGASGYLLKQARGAELADQLERVMAGEVVVDPALVGQVARTAAQLHAGEFWPGAHLGLTQRESEVLGLLVRGLSNRAIAGELVIGEETVKTHVGSIYRKLGVSDRTQAVAAALRDRIFR
jgi:DNA-binding NarL/FixJ family response regulator